MSVTIGYDEDQFPLPFDASSSLRDVLEEFQDSGLEGSHPNNTGGFFGSSSAAYGGERYAYSDSSGYAFSAHGDLVYDFATHTLEGSLSKIELGGGLGANGYVSDPFLVFDFATNIEGDAATEGRDNLVHDVLWGLMNGSVNGYYESGGGPSEHGGLIALLDDLITDSNGVDAAVEDIGSALPSLLVGIADTSEFDFALAA
ncbi:MAG: heme acquisition protein HasA [Halomonas sp.]|uniref:Heme acquisition protein HasAp n=3 Tax=Halomonas TaxID=2745 RepID=A0ABR9EWZ6_9GAMM|nr:heme acquisition protein HasA [Halomonas casei]MBE0398740.1 heme acquisition protein HasAp [Halomonas casei]